MDITLGIFKDSPNKAETQKILSKTSETSVGVRPKSSFTSSLELLTPELINKTRPRSVEGSTSNKKIANNRSQTPESKKDDEEKERMKKAIIKMKKLDKILAEKTLQEKQIKLQRLQNEWNLHNEMGRIDETQTDVVNNTSKYLALLPPIQQLEVLIERCQSAVDDDDFSEPIFQTQFPEEEFSSLHSVKSNPPSPHQRSKSSASQQKKEEKQKKKTQTEEKGKDFIKRNIELVKDAGNLIMMTDEEKERLSQLLSDVDTGEEETTTIVAADNEIIEIGYQPVGNDMNRLNEIDEQLLTITNDTPRGEDGSMLQNYKDPILTTESNLTQVFNPEKRFEEIEDRLHKLDAEWKEKFESEEPRLDEMTLNDLLSPYLPLTPRTNSSTVDDDTISLYSSSTVISLSRLQLDQLLLEARTCLGLPPSMECITEEDDGVNDGDLSIQNLDDSPPHTFVETCINSPSPVDR